MLQSINVTQIKLSKTYEEGQQICGKSWKKYFTGYVLKNPILHFVETLLDRIQVQQFRFDGFDHVSRLTSVFIVCLASKLNPDSGFVNSSPRIDTILFQSSYQHLVEFWKYFKSISGSKFAVSFFKFISRNSVVQFPFHSKNSMKKCFVYLVSSVFLLLKIHSW